MIRPILPVKRLKRQRDAKLDPKQDSLGPKQTALLIPQTLCYLAFFILFCAFIMSEGKGET